MLFSWVGCLTTRRGIQPYRSSTRWVHTLQEFHCQRVRFYTFPSYHSQLHLSLRSSYLRFPASNPTALSDVSTLFRCVSRLNLSPRTQIVSMNHFKPIFENMLHSTLVSQCPPRSEKRTHTAMQQPPGCATQLMTPVAIYSLHMSKHTGNETQPYRLHRNALHPVA